MLKFGNKEFRNLQEQVFKNMQDIKNMAEGTAVLSEFGIKVVGEVATESELPTVEEYKTAHADWEYGDAFAIGTTAPYTLVILTRANDEIETDHWFDIGEFPAPGPQGAQGPQGEVGPQGQTGQAGADGTDAGFGTVSATAQTLVAGSPATVSVTASGPNTAKEFSFTFGIPRGADGQSVSAAWGTITGTLSDQTDLQSALDDKQDELVSGTNIKTINNTSILGSGNIDIQSQSAVWGSITGTLSDQTDLNTALAAKQDIISDLATIRAGAALGATAVQPTAISDMATQTWVNNQGFAEASDIPTAVSELTNDAGYITGITSSMVTTALGYTPGTSNFSGDYDDLTNKPTIPTVSGTNDGTNWTTITINSDTYAIPQGGGTGTVTDVEVNGTSVVNAQGVAEVTVPTNYVTDVTLGGTSVVSSGVAVLPAYPTVSVTDVTIGGTSCLSGTTAVIPALFSGSYNDLTDKPTIPAAQVNSDWNAASGVAQILNKPTIYGTGTETWTFTLSDGTTTTKTIVVG